MCIRDRYVNALYAVFNTKIKKWGFSLGLRGEMTNTNARQADSTDNKNTYYSLYPTGAISYNINKKQQIQFSYSRRAVSYTHLDVYKRQTINSAP